MFETKNHPSEETLARIAGGEAAWTERLRWSGHARCCRSCEDRLLRYQFDRSLIAEAAPDVRDLDWDRS